MAEHKLKSAALTSTEKLSPLNLKSLSLNLRQVKLPDGTETVFLKENITIKTNAINVYYQRGAESARNNVLVDLFHQGLLFNFKILNLVKINSPFSINLNSY